MTLATVEPRPFTAKILEAREECRNVKTFRLSVPDWFSFVPGQWAMFHFADDPKLQRAYSISSSPLVRGHIEISLNDVGPFTDRLFKLRGGETLEAKGPYGKWVYKGEPNAVLVSGGTGVTPFRAMGLYHMEAKLPGKLTILHSAKTREDILYKSDFARFRAHGIKEYTTLTGETWEGPMGRLTPDIVARETPGFPDADFFFCGPNAFVKELVAGLAAKGVPDERLHREKWGDYKL